MGIKGVNEAETDKFRIPPSPYNYAEDHYKVLLVDKNGNPLIIKESRKVGFKKQ